MVACIIERTPIADALDVIDCCGCRNPVLTHTMDTQRMRLQVSLAGALPFARVILFAPFCSPLMLSLTGFRQPGSTLARRQEGAHILLSPAVLTILPLTGVLTNRTSLLSHLNSSI
jgi:hypothetical protein